MQISKRITINNNIYYVIVDVEYKKRDNGRPSLCLKDYKDSYWDDRDFSILIEEIEKSYTPDKIKQYENESFYIRDILYIYNRIPFLSGIKDIYISSKDNIIYADGYITKEEIDEYITNFNVKMNNNPDFKLSDARTWKL